MEDASASPKESFEQRQEAEEAAVQLETDAAEETSPPVFSPGKLRVNKRHTRILGTLNKRATKEFINL